MGAIHTTPRGITQQPRAPGGVAAFISAHSKTPHVTTGMDLPCGKGVAWGRGGQQLRFTLHTHAKGTYTAPPFSVIMRWFPKQIA